MAHWFHTNFSKVSSRLEPEIKKNGLIFCMINKTASGTYPNINAIKEGDKIIFLEDLVAIGSGKIILIERSKKPKFSCIGKKKYPLRITYATNQFKKYVDLRDPAMIEFLQHVPFENSKHGTFLAKNKNAVKILPKRLASTYQRINEEIYDEIIHRSKL